MLYNLIYCNHHKTAPTTQQQLLQLQKQEQDQRQQQQCSPVEVTEQEIQEQLSMLAAQARQKGEKVPDEASAR